MNRLTSIKNQISQNDTNPKQTEFTKLSIYHQGSVGYISLRSPKDLNCLSQTMIKEICQAMEILQNDESSNVIVIISELANVFCAGADIK